MQDLSDKPTREAQVLALAAEGMTDKQIAGELGISLATVDTYWRRIKTRLGSSSRTEAVSQAIQIQWAEAVTVVRDENSRLLQEVKAHIAYGAVLRQRIEDQKLIEEALHVEVGRLLQHFWRSRLLVAHLGAVMWWAHAEHPWIIEWISDSVLQWGYEPSELEGQKPILHLVLEGDHVPFEAGTLLACRSPLKPIDREYRIRTQSGDARRVRERLVCAKHPIDDAPLLVGIQLDVEPTVA